MANNFFRSRNQSFTLIELLIVVAIIGILAALIIVSVTTAAARSRDASRAEQFKEIQNALSEYYIQNGSYPPQASWCYSLSGQSNGCFQQALQPLITQGFLSALPTPEYPGGGEYDYQSPVHYGYNITCGTQSINQNIPGSYILAWTTETIQPFAQFDGSNENSCGSNGGRCCIYVQ
jgi:prepilin-type N-terminal cleavage/methylation domain